MKYGIYFFFFFSGVAGLIYEATWARYLKLFLGHSSYGQLLTLVIYMGGLGAGSFLAAKVSRRLKNPMAVYALLEVGIAVQGLLYHPFFDASTLWFFSAIAFRGIDPAFAEFLKILLSVVLTAPGAVMLGMTFPVLAAALNRLQKDDGQSSLPLLYFSNSIGAALGVVTASYVFIPGLGTHGTLYVAVAFNLFAAAGTGWLSRGSIRSPLQSEGSVPSRILKNGLDRHIKLWLLIAFLTGLTSFLYEVSWIRLLSMMMGSSTHSFDVMLSTFILGLAAGAIFARWLLRNTDGIRALAMVQLFMGCAAASTVYLAIPFFHAMNEANLIFNSTSQGYISWSIFKYLLCVLWMAPTTFFAGTTLPLITWVLQRWTRDERYTGRVYGWNTLGAILGALLGVLVFIPLLQLKYTLAFAALSDVATGLLLLAIYHRQSLKHWTLIGTAIALPALAVPFSGSLLGSGVFRTHQNMHKRETVTLHDGRTASISFHETRIQKIIKTNGKPDASIGKDTTETLLGDELTQAATAYVPMALFNKPYHAALIGFGSGMNAHYLLTDPLVKTVDVVEIEKEMVELSRGFLPRNQLAYEDPRIHVFIDDARTFFTTRGKRYDLMISVPSNPWVSGVSALFSTEFYRQILPFLSEDGVLLQWLQLYEFDSVLLLNILKALDENFPHVAIYRIPDEPDILILASGKPVRQAYGERLKKIPLIQREFRRMKRPVDFFGEHNYVISARGLANIFPKVQPNSDYNPLVDAAAEKARYLNTGDELIDVLIPKELSWQFVLEGESYERRLLDINRWKRSKKIPLDKHRSMMFRLQHADDSTNWDRLYQDYRDLLYQQPFDASRDRLPETLLLKKRIDALEVPEMVALEFEFWERLRARKWKSAAMLVPRVREIYDLGSVDPDLLRGMFIACLKGGKKDELGQLYRQGFLMNKNIPKIEKRLVKNLRNRAYGRL